MAEIDKSLPNVKQTLKVPSQQQQMEIQAEAQASTPTQPEVTKNEDGSAEITFEPGAVNQAGGQDHYANLADLLPDNVLDPLGSELWNNYDEYRRSRRQWADSYTKGLDLLGLSCFDSFIKALGSGPLTGGIKFHFTCLIFLVKIGFI